MYKLWLRTADLKYDFHEETNKQKKSLKWYSVHELCLVAQSCLTLCNPMDCSPPGSSVLRILQAKILEWAAMPSSRGSSQPKDETHISQFSSVAQSCPSDSLPPHELQHNRPPCPSPTPGVHSNSCPSSWWCHRAISSSVVLFLMPPIPPSSRFFSNESSLRVRWPKYWSFSFSIIPSKEPPGLISFRMDWLNLLAVQRTLKSLLQHHTSKASILQRSAFFTVQLSHPYMTTGKTKALTRRTFVGKVMSLLFNMLSRLVIIFLPRSKHLLISWRQSPSAVILKPKKIKSATVSPSISHEVMGPWEDGLPMGPWAMIFVFCEL